MPWITVIDIVSSWAASIIVWIIVQISTIASHVIAVDFLRNLYNHFVVGVAGERNSYVRSGQQVSGCSKLLHGNRVIHLIRIKPW